MEEHSSWVQVAKGKKIPLVINLVVQDKFIEEKVIHTKEINLQVCGLPKINTPLQVGHIFIHDTLDLKT